MENLSVQTRKTREWSFEDVKTTFDSLLSTCSLQKQSFLRTLTGHFLAGTFDKQNIEDTNLLLWEINTEIVGFTSLIKEDDQI